MNIEKNDSTVTVTVTEDITSVTVPEIRDQILKTMDAEVIQIHMDLNQVEMVDSTGISLLISIQNSLKKNSGELSLLNTSGDIVHMFKLMRLDKFFKVIPR